MKAVTGSRYTALQIYRDLDLSDKPSMCFAYQGVPAVIQDSHVSAAAILAIDDGFLDTIWELVSTTDLVQVFVYSAGNSNILNFVDVAPWTAWDGQFLEGTWWATLRAWPRPQPRFEATVKSMSIR